MPRWRIVRT